MLAGFSSKASVVRYNVFMQRTIRLKLTPSIMQAESFAETSRQFTSAFNQAVQLGWDANVSNATKLHYLAYYPVKAAHPTLVSDLINQARVKGAGISGSGGLPVNQPIVSDLRVEAQAAGF
jgi:putative transposase